MLAKEAVVDQHPCLSLSMVSGLDTAFGVANAKLTASLTKLQQQMKQQEWSVYQEAGVASTVAASDT